MSLLGLPLICPVYFLILCVWLLPWPQEKHQPWLLLSYLWSLFCFPWASVCFHATQFSAEFFLVFPFCFILTGFQVSTSPTRPWQGLKPMVLFRMSAPHHHEFTNLEGCTSFSEYSLFSLVSCPKGSNKKSYSRLDFSRIIDIYRWCISLWHYDQANVHLSTCFCESGSTR